MSYEFLVASSIGVLVALATGLGSLAFGASFLTSTFDYFTLPLIGEFELASAMLFDTGVFLTVLGAVLLALAQLSHISQRAARAYAEKQDAEADETAQGEAP
jgi:multicomponent K+:H+ antiporter subunit A